MTDLNMSKPARSRGATRLGALGLTLAGSAIVNKTLAARAEQQSPPLGRFIQVAGIRVHYLERGIGPAIVLLHGNASMVEDFIVSGLFDRLAVSHRVIAFDRPGCGHSDRPDDRNWTVQAQAALLAQAAGMLGVESPIVVGHSFGTLVALAWALDRPDEIAGLALLSGYYFPTQRVDSMMQRVIGLPGISAFLTNTLLPIQGRLTGALGNQLIFAPAKPTQAFLDDTPFAMMLRPGALAASVADGAQLPGAAASLCGRYGELMLPMLIAWGSGDKLVGQHAQSERLATELPHAAALCLPGVGHMVHHSAPEQIADAIEALATSVWDAAPDTPASEPQDNTSAAREKMFESTPL